jgi:hypothetical protein
MNIVKTFLKLQILNSRQVVHGVIRGVECPTLLVGSHGVDTLIVTQKSSREKRGFSLYRTATP